PPAICSQLRPALNGSVDTALQEENTAARPACATQPESAIDTARFVRLGDLPQYAHFMIDAPLLSLYHLPWTRKTWIPLPDRQTPDGTETPGPVGWSGTRSEAGMGQSHCPYRRAEPGSFKPFKGFCRAVPRHGLDRRLVVTFEEVCDGQRGSTRGAGCWRR